MNDSDFYSVKVKNGAGWRAYNTARLQISVGQKYHEDEKLLATLNWANEHFEKIIICVNDTLQRHNYEFGNHTQEKAFSISEAEGRYWIERNYDFFKQLQNYELIRWEKWRSDPTYKFGLKVMEKMYAQKPAFRQEIDNEIDAFWNRALKRGNAPDESRREAFSKHSRRYLLEECAIFQLMFAHDTAVDIYPGSTLLPCKLRESKDLGIRGYTRIDFRRKAA